MAGKKIGVLTFHSCINYGSYWQARSLVEGIEAKGHRASILNHFSRRVNIAEWRCALNPVLPSPTPVADVPLYRKKIRRFHEAFENLPLSARFPLTRPAEMAEYDVAVVGSDEVWNLFHPWYHDCPLFYGDGIKATALISYAASFGNYRAAEGLGREWAEKLDAFDAISVRDENSRQLLVEALALDPVIVLDPCLQFDSILNTEACTLDGPRYIAVYGHNFSAHFIQYAKAWAARSGFRLVSIGYRNDWADEQWLDAGPLQFAAFMKGAEAVVTNFFHGTVFALRYEKPFACETSDYRSIKLQGLVSLLAAGHHLVTNASSDKLFEDLLTQPLSAAISQNLTSLRQRSDDFLDSALNQTQLKVA